MLFGCNKFSKIRTVRGLLLGECRVASRVMVKSSVEPYLWRMSEDGITRMLILGVFSGGEESPQMLRNRPNIMIIDEDGKVSMKEIRCFLVSI